MTGLTNPTTILERTEKGRESLLARSKALSGRARMFLFAADGKRTYDELLEATGNAVANQATLEALIAAGYMKRAGDPDAPASNDAAPPAAESRPAVPPAKPFDPGETTRSLSMVSTEYSVLLAQAKEHTLAIMRPLLGQDTDSLLQPLRDAKSQTEFLNEMILCHQLLKDLVSREEADRLVNFVKTLFKRAPSPAAA
jgi:hypothetical protein